MNSGDEAEKLVGGVRKRRLRGDGPASSGELPHPIGIEVATAYVYTAVIVWQDVGISIIDVIFWGATLSNRVRICGIQPRMRARRKLGG
jgi:hypothetical protein